MLLQFSVSNFRSFKDEQFITMIPAKVKGHEENIAHVEPGLDVLRSAVIYGANASGKSNFVRALRTFIRLVRMSSDKKPNEPFEEYQPYRLLLDAKKKPIKFSIDFLIGNIRYRYGLSYLQDKVISEKLTFFPQGREAKLFDREEQKFGYGEYFKGPKKLLEQITAPNQLLLSKAATNNVEAAIKIFSFFQSVYIISNYNDVFEKALTKATISFSEREGQRFRNRIHQLFTALDTGIINFEIEDFKSSSEPDNISQSELPDFQPEFKIKMLHTAFDNGVRTQEAFDLHDESAGTQKLFGLSGLIVDVLEKGWVFIFDELERSLHPHISRFIISLFNNPKINKNNAQLIAATHDVTLLSEENKLRRDQIWIVEKNEQGASQMISLADMKGIRDNVPFEKWYLSGRFGGVPNIESLQFEFDFADEKTENNFNEAH